MYRNSLVCVSDSEKSVETTNAVRAIVCDSEKSRFNSVCKADLSVCEVEINLKMQDFRFEMLISEGFHNCALNKK